MSSIFEMHLGADHQDRVGGPGLDERRGGRHRVGEARARRVHVERRARHAQLALHPDGGGGDRRVPGQGRADDEVDVLGQDARRVRAPSSPPRPPGPTPRCPRRRSSSIGCPSAPRSTRRWCPPAIRSTRSGSGCRGGTSRHRRWWHVGSQREDSVPGRAAQARTSACMSPESGVRGTWCSAGPWPTVHAGVVSGMDDADRQVMEAAHRRAVRLDVGRGCLIDEGSSA